MNNQYNHSTARSRSLAYSTIDEGEKFTAPCVSGSPPHEQIRAMTHPRQPGLWQRQSY